MSLIDRNRNPTGKDLSLFGGLLVPFFGLLGGLSLYQSGGWMVAAIIWCVGLITAGLYYAVPTSQAIIFQTWMAVVYPIGWLISHSLLAIIYYAVITPIGVARRFWNRDPLQEKADPSATTYWAACTIETDSKRYFQQY